MMAQVLTANPISEVSIFKQIINYI